MRLYADLEEILKQAPHATAELEKAAADNAALAARLADCEKDLERSAVEYTALEMRACDKTARLQAPHDDAVKKMLL